MPKKDFSIRRAERKMQNSLSFPSYMRILLSENPFVNTQNAENMQKNTLYCLFSSRNEPFLCLPNAFISYIINPKRNTGCRTYSKEAFMKFGYFDDAKREYVITSPRTPYPWINYLGTQGFFSLISNTAGGYSFYKDARLRRITRYRITTSRLIWADGISTSMKTVPSGTPAGHPSRPSSTAMNAVTAWATRSLPVRRTA